MFSLFSWLSCLLQSIVTSLFLSTPCTIFSSHQSGRRELLWHYCKQCNAVPWLQWVVVVVQRPWPRHSWRINNRVCRTFQVLLNHCVARIEMRDTASFLTHAFPAIQVHQCSLHYWRYIPVSQLCSTGQVSIASAFPLAVWELKRRMR